jgi:hypothetical protein
MASAGGNVRLSQLHSSCPCAFCPIHGTWVTRAPYEAATGSFRLLSRSCSVLFEVVGVAVAAHEQQTGSDSYEVEAEQILGTGKCLIHLGQESWRRQVDEGGNGSELRMWEASEEMKH